MLPSLMAELFLGLKPPRWCEPVQKGEEAKGHPPCPSSSAGSFESLQEGSGPDPTPFLLEGPEEFEQMHPKAGEGTPGWLLFPHWLSVRC